MGARILAGVVAGALCVGAVGASAAWAGAASGSGTGASPEELRQQAEAMCADDAMRFCSEVIFDEPRAIDCMRAHRSQLSPACRSAARAFERR